MNYVFFTTHFVDYDWQLHTKILRLCLIANHKGETIEKTSKASIMKGGLEQLLIMMVDNALSNYASLEYLNNKLRDDNFSILGGDFLCVWCVVHIFNLVMDNGLRNIH